MKITFDPTNLRSEMVGEHGITKDELRLAIAAGRRLLLRSFAPRSIKDLYGFPNLPFDKAMIGPWRLCAGQRGKFDTICVAGIGGSALGAWALDCAMRGQHPIQDAFSTKNPRLVILDNVDPAFVASAIASMNPEAHAGDPNREIRRDGRDDVGVSDL